MTDVFVVPNYDKVLSLNSFKLFSSHNYSSQFFRDKAMDTKFGRYAELDWTQHMFKFEPTDESEERPLGV